MDRYYCVCGDTLSTRPELEAHCGCLPGVHVEDEEYADASQASPDAPGDAQAHVPDQMPETAPAEPQSADKSVGVPTRQYGTVRLPTQSSTFTARLMYAPDQAPRSRHSYRMELIAALAELASLQMDSNHEQDAYAAIQRIHKLAVEL